MEGASKEHLTVSLPADLAAFVDRLSRERGTTAAEALTLLAEEGAKHYSRPELAGIGEARWQAFIAADPSADGPYPSLEEMARASTLLREELAGEYD
jgi:hypothetical protein